MASYRLSPLAEQDFSRLIEYGSDTFGAEHAIRYALGMEQRFLAICANPLAYTAVDDIRENSQ